MLPPRLDVIILINKSRTRETEDPRETEETKQAARRKQTLAYNMKPVGQVCEQGLVIPGLVSLRSTPYSSRIRSNTGCILHNERRKDTSILARLACLAQVLGPDRCWRAESLPMRPAFWLALLLLCLSLFFPFSPSLRGAESEVAPVLIGWRPR